MESVWFFVCLFFTLKMLKLYKQQIALFGWHFKGKHLKSAKWCRLQKEQMTPSYLKVILSVYMQPVAKHIPHD